MCQAHIKCRPNLFTIGWYFNWVPDKLFLSYCMLEDNGRLRYRKTAGNCIVICAINMCSMSIRCTFYHRLSVFISNLEKICNSTLVIIHKPHLPFLSPVASQPKAIHYFSCWLHKARKAQKSIWLTRVYGWPKQSTQGNSFVVYHGLDCHVPEAIHKRLCLSVPWRNSGVSLPLSLLASAHISLLVGVAPSPH